MSPKSAAIASNAPFNHFFQIYRSVRVRLPTITRHDGAVTVGDQNRRLGVQVIVDVYEKWLRGVAADRQRFFER